MGEKVNPRICSLTTTLSPHSRGKDKAIKYIEKVKGNSKLVTTSINTFELYYGAFKYSKGVQKLDEFL
jgi:predicted nucleic acid-binding protein